MTAALCIWHAQLLHQGLEELIRVQGGRGRGLFRNTVQKKTLLTPVSRRAKAFSKLRCAPAYDLRLKLIRLQMIEYLVVHVGTS